MATRPTVYARGLDETVRALGKVSKDLRRDVQREIAKVTKIVADEARVRIDAEFGAGTGRFIRPRVRGARGFAQSTARSQHIRPNFGQLIMERGLLPAAAAKEDDVVRGFEQMLDRLVRDNRFSRRL